MKDSKIQELLNTVIECGKIMLEAFGKKKIIDSKEGIGNIVTMYDISIEGKLKAKLLELYPNSSFIGEEETSERLINSNGYTFIVDPIDGTTNFYRELSLSVISIGILKDGKPFIGICYNPYLNEMFFAKKDEGAYLNNKRIYVSDKSLKEGIIFTGSSSYYAELRDKSFNIINILSKEASDFRRLGSAALELCYIACGRAEMYFELKVQPWDYCAGSIIVSEALGKVTDMEGNELQYLNSSSIIASNNKEKELHKINILN